MRIAVFGDIHGNIFALQAVLADLRVHSPDGMVLTGDLAYKLPWGAEAIDLLRTLPHQAVLGNSELYLTLWDTPLWPEKQWNMPLARQMLLWERERLGPERVRYLSGLPEYVALSASRLEDLLIVHGVPGNPFVPFLARPSKARPPWTHTDARLRELSDGVDADIIVCGHTHTTLLRQSSHGPLIVNPGALGYGRGRATKPGLAGYALLDWSAAKGWRATLHTVHYDPMPLYVALLALRGDYPIAEFMANRMRPPGAPLIPGQRPDFVRFRWGNAPEWWQDRDDLPAWQILRENGGVL